MSTNPTNETVSITNPIILIIENALELLKTQTPGAVQDTEKIAILLLNIYTTAQQEYEKQVGQPIDPSLIKEEDTI